MPAHRYAHLAAALAVATCATLRAPLPAAAHGLPPLPLALWGPFATPTVECLRHLSRATRRCFNVTLTAHRACMDKRLAGETCNEAQRDAVITAARAAAVATVDASCRGGQLTELRFANADDARADVLRACAEADTTLRSVYAAALNPVTAPQLSAADHHCMTHAGAAASKLLNAIANDQSRVFDAAAVHILAPSQKLGRFNAAVHRLTAARQHMAPRMAEACAGTTVYERDADSFLALLERRAACLLSSVYFHTSVTCPTPVCGDAIVDSGEECDDGNGIDADGCHADCTMQ